MIGSATRKQCEEVEIGLVAVYMACEIYSYKDDDCEVCEVMRSIAR